MREILYRGLNTNSEFVYGLPYLDAPNSTAYYNDYSYRITWIPENGGHANQPVKNGTIGQFTGLKDKDCVEIFEGDIVEAWGLVCVIKWIESDASFFAESICGEVCESGQEWSGRCKIIGNIHQNPELLEENT